MDESLRQQILAVALLRPHSTYFSNCSYLLRQKRKKPEQTSFCDCTVVSALLPPPRWAGTAGVCAQGTGTTRPITCSGSPAWDAPLAFAGLGFDGSVVSFLSAVSYQLLQVLTTSVDFPESCHAGK